MAKVNNDTVRNIVYRTIDNSTLTMDIYYPPNIADDTQLPVVVFVFGFPDSAAEKIAGVKLKDFQQYINWGNWTAQEGMIAVTYETQQPHVDLEVLVEHLRENAVSLNIDPERIGLWSCSGNVPTAMSYVKNEMKNYIKFSAYLYGPMFTPDQKYHNQINALAEKLGFFYSELKIVEQLPKDIPLFIVRAGKDEMEPINESIEHFITHSLANNVPLTLINYAEGAHAFDISDNSEEAQEVIKQILEFMKSKLAKP
jgi:hypothetical protein